MPNNCLICREKTPPYLSVFQFPSDPHRRQEWCESLELTIKLPKRAVVCEKHFGTEQFSNNQRKRLKLDANPTRECRDLTEELGKLTEEGKSHKSRRRKDGKGNGKPAAWRSTERELKQCKLNLNRLNLSLENVLNWIRAANDNRLPEEVVQLVDPLFLNESEGSSFSVDPDEEEAESDDDVKADIEREDVHSESGDHYYYDNSDTKPVADTPSQPSSPSDVKVDVSSISPKINVEQNLDPSGSRKCSYCDQEFDSLVELSKHALTHCGVRITRLRKKYFLSRTVKVRKAGSSSKRPKINFKKRKVPGKHSEPIYRYCHVCPEKFRVKTLLVAHVRSQHPGVLPFKCEQCGKTSATERSLNHHMESNHPNPSNAQSHLCSICGKTFGVLRNLQKHLANVHSKEKNYQCPYCSYATTTSSQLVQHRNRHLKRDQEQCPHCGILKSKPTMKHHIEAVHEGKRLKCNICCNVIHSKNILRQHFLFRHPDFPSTVAPADCVTVIYVEPRHGQKRKYFPDPADTEQSEEPIVLSNTNGVWEVQVPPPRKLPNPVKPRRSRSKQFPIKECEVCNKWIDLDVFSEHMSRYHADPFKCKLCEVEFYSFNELNQHFVTVHFADSATTKIPVDGNTVDDSLRQRYPGLIHETEQLVCIMCDNHPFNKRSELAAHLERHRRNPDYRMIPRYTVEPVVQDLPVELALSGELVIDDSYNVDGPEETETEDQVPDVVPEDSDNGHDPKETETDVAVSDVVPEPDRDST